MQTSNYFYDNEDMRVKKVTSSGTSYYIDKYTEITPDGVIRHIYANDKLVASIDELGQTTYNHQDHLMSSNLRTDDQGAVVKRSEYLPFGSTRSESGSYDRIKLRYTSQYQDEESGLYYYKRRFYNPELGRFISADPLYAEEIDERGIDSQELNFYAYVRNNPLKYIDPTGESNLNSFFAMIGQLGVADQVSAEAKGAAQAYTKAAVATAAVSATPFVAAGVVAGSVAAVSSAPAIYSTALSSATGVYMRNPQLAQNISEQSVDFMENLSGSLGGETTFTAPDTPGGYGGFLLGEGIKYMGSKFGTGDVSPVLDSSIGAGAGNNTSNIHNDEGSFIE